jgi:adenylate cyclase
MPTPAAVLNSPRRRQGLLAGLIAFLLIAGLFEFGRAFPGLAPLQRLENLGQDWERQRYAQPYQAPIEIVLLDDVSLRQAEEQFSVKFPWPREVYANAVDFLRSAGAKAVVFDFLFTSASSYGPDDDAAFAKAVRRQGHVTAGMQFDAADQPEARRHFAALPPLHRDPLAAGPLELARGVDAPQPPLWAAFAAVGDTSFEQDADGQGRRYRLAVALQTDAAPNTAATESFPSLALAAARDLGAPEPDWSGLRQGKQSLLFRQPKGAAGSSRLFDVAASWAKLQAGEKPLVDPARFQGKIVLIGSSAPGLNDLRSCPMAKNLPGVELQAMALDNLISGQSLRVLHPNLAYWLALALLCLAVARYSFRLKGAWVLLPLLAVAGANTGLGLWLYQAQHLLIPLALPAAAAILAFTHGAVENYALELASRQRVTAVFGQFLSPAVVAGLKEKGGRLEMGGETRQLTVFFSDLQGFTSFSEKLSPPALVEILNEYLTEMGDVVVGRFDGTVDKYIGDAIMAFWNAPLDQGDHAWRGCAAAWACQVRLAEIQASLKAKGLDAGDEGMVMRIGLNTGPAVAGLMGSQRKLNYTVMGDTVNTASRLEGANKPYGSRILVSQATLDAAGPRVLNRPLDYIKVKGKAEPTAVFQVIGLQGEPGRLFDEAYVAAWTGSLAHYKDGRFSEALAGFEACSRQQPKDLAARLFIDRCAHYLQEPPQTWDGVYTMKTK